MSVIEDLEVLKGVSVILVILAGGAWFIVEMFIPSLSDKVKRGINIVASLVVILGGSTIAAIGDIWATTSTYEQNILQIPIYDTCHGDGFEGYMNIYTMTFSVSYEKEGVEHDYGLIWIDDMDLGGTSGIAMTSSLIPLINFPVAKLYIQIFFTLHRTIKQNCGNSYFDIDFVPDSNMIELLRDYPTGGIIITAMELEVINDISPTTYTCNLWVEVYVADQVYHTLWAGSVMRTAGEAVLLEDLVEA